MERDATASSPRELGSVLTSEAFYLNCFKILPCSKRYSHEWTTCAFAHPGEKAKRRDPQCYSYDCEMCPAVVKGEVCELGLACPHSHHVFESWLHPQKFRTMLCKDGDACNREVCFFAHGAEQLRVPSRDPSIATCLGGPSRLRTSSCGPSLSSQQQQHKQQQQQHPSAAAPASRGVLQPAISSQAAWNNSEQQQQQQQASAVGRPSVHFSSCINTVLGAPVEPAARYNDPATIYNGTASRAAGSAVAQGPSACSLQLSGGSRQSSACESCTSSMTSVPAVLQMAGYDWQVLQGGTAAAAARLPVPGTPAAAAVDGGLSEMYGLLNKLVEEVQVRRQEAQQSKNAEELAKEQLRAVMTALSVGSGSSVADSTPGEPGTGLQGTNAGLMPPGLCQVGPSGFDAASMQAQLPLQAQGPGLCRDGSGSGNWMQMSGLSGPAGSRNNMTFQMLELRSQQQQQQQAAYSSSSSASSNISMMGPVGGWMMAPGGSSSNSTADNMLSWSQLSRADGLQAAEGANSSSANVLPAMCGIAAAGGCSPPSAMLEHASRPLASYGGLPSGSYAETAAMSADAAMLQSPASGLPLPASGIGAAGVVTSPQVVSGSSGLGCHHSVTFVPMLPSDHLLQLQCMPALQQQQAVAGAAAGQASSADHSGTQSAPCSFADHLQMKPPAAMASSAGFAYSSGQLLQAGLAAAEEVLSTGSFENLMSPTGVDMCAGGTVVSIVSEGCAHQQLGWL